MVIRSGFAPGPGALPPAHRDPDGSVVGVEGESIHGEALAIAASRLVAEQAGVRSSEVWPVDLAGDPAVFALDLGDEHAESALRRGWSRDNQSTADADTVTQTVNEDWLAVADIPPVTIQFEPMTTQDLTDVLRWQQSSGASEWFSAGPVDLIAAIVRYGARFKGESSTRMWVVVIDGQRSGYVQDYPVDHLGGYASDTGHPEAIGIDFVLGEPQLLGRGLGPRVLWTYLRDLLCLDYPAAPTFLASPDRRNARSVRALEKCGFTQGRQIDLPAEPGATPVEEVVCTFDRATWFGPPAAPPG